MINLYGRLYTFALELECNKYGTLACFKFSTSKELRQLVKSREVKEIRSAFPGVRARFRLIEQY